MQALSEWFRDRPQSPLETAIFWTEYEIRHSGAPHLRTAALDLTWCQYLLLDVITVLIVAGIIITTALYLIVRKFCWFCSTSKLHRYGQSSSMELKKT
jgi:glucuronosyltransferase